MLPKQTGIIKVNINFHGVPFVISLTITVFSFCLSISNVLSIVVSIQSKLENLTDFLAVASRQMNL